ncbi:MAG: hypothetical protein ACMUIU_08755 [bacterium]
MNREELKEIISAVVKKMEASSPADACIFWDQPVITTYYGIGEEDPTTRYAINEEDPTTKYAINEEDVTTLYGISEEG